MWSQHHKISDIPLTCKPIEYGIDICLSGLWHNSMKWSVNIWKNIDLLPLVPSRFLPLSLLFSLVTLNFLMQAISLREMEDITSLEEKLGRSLSKQERSRIGVSKLRLFLEELLQKRFAIFSWFSFPLFPYSYYIYVQLLYSTVKFKKIVIPGIWIMFHWSFHYWKRSTAVQQERWMK